MNYTFINQIPTHCEIWNPTMHLRFRTEQVSDYFKHEVLQQAWVELATGKVEWRDVPTEKSP